MTWTNEEEERCGYDYCYPDEDEKCCPKENFRESECAKIVIERKGSLGKTNERGGNGRGNGSQGGRGNGTQGGKSNGKQGGKSENGSGDGNGGGGRG